jgi:hypothetical protein
MSRRGAGWARALVSFGCAAHRPTFQPEAGTATGLVHRELNARNLLTLLCHDAYPVVFHVLESSPWFPEHG